MLLSARRLEITRRICEQGDSYKVIAIDMGLTEERVKGDAKVILNFYKVPSKDKLIVQYWRQKYENK